MSRRIYIDDFVDFFNYVGIILYIGKVDSSALLKALDKDKVNKTYRLSGALTDSEESMRNFIFIENCDLQILDHPLYEYLDEGYDVFVLYEDDGRYYIKERV